MGGNAASRDTRKKNKTYAHLCHDDECSISGNDIVDCACTLEKEKMARRTSVEVTVLPANLWICFQQRRSHAIAGCTIPAAVGLLERGLEAVPLGSCCNLTRSTRAFL
jgi:hypothetical protein